MLMTHRGTKVVTTVLALGIVIGTARAADIKTVTKELFAVPSTTGNEEMLAARIRGLLPRKIAVETAGLGTIAVRLGGTPGPTLILAALDDYGHMVGGITPEGYLTLDRPVPPPNGRFDGFLLGQPVIIRTATSPVQGVVSQPAMHLLTPERRKTLVEGFSLETAFVDIGARSEKEARAKGVELLDPVTYPAVLTELAGGQWAGPSLGVKSAAAALVAVIDGMAGGTAGEETVLAWAAQTKFAARGRGARPAVGTMAANSLWRPKRTIIVDVVAAGQGDGSPVPGGGPVLVLAKDEPSALRQALESAAAAAGVTLQRLTASLSPMAAPFAAAPSEVITLALPVRFLNTPSEVVALKDLEALRDILVRFLQPRGAK
jgi:putative aminopeptidase FrvX